MAKLTKRQKTAIELLAIYTQDATMEIEENGLTEKYYRKCAMCVSYREELGLDVPDYQRIMANRYEEIMEKRDVA